MPIGGPSEKLGGGGGGGRGGGGGGGGGGSHYDMHRYIHCST